MSSKDVNDDGSMAHVRHTATNIAHKEACMIDAMKMLVVLLA